MSCLLLPTYVAKLSTMTQDAMVYKVSSCCCFFVVVFFFIVAQLKLGITPFTEDPRCRLPFH